MTELDTDHSPGCYGSAMTYREGTPECETCPFVVSCAPLSTARLAALREKFGVAPIKKSSRSRTPATAAVPSGFAPSSAVATLLERMASLNIVETLRQGQNPFTVGFPFMRIACHVLLHRPQGTTEQELTMAFMQKMDWKETTSKVYASQAAQALTMIGATQRMNGRLILRRFDNA
jgi:hypothetical protein